MAAKLPVLAAGILLLCLVSANASFPADPVLDKALAAVSEASQMEDDDSKMQAWDQEAAAALSSAVPAKLPAAPNSASFSAASVPFGVVTMPVVKATVPKAMLQVAPAGSNVFEGVNVEDVTPKLAPMVDDHVSPSTQDMEAAVESLVLGKSIGASGAAFKATPMGSSIGAIKALLEKTMMPKIMHGHKTDQNELNRLMADVRQCGAAKKVGLSAAIKKKAKYERLSPTHKICRGLEAVIRTEKSACWNALEDKKRIKKLKCSEFALVAKRMGDENANRQIMKKAGSESVESYITRITTTVCGTGAVNKPGRKKLQKKTGRKRGSQTSMYAEFMKAKYICVKATKVVRDMTHACQKKSKKYRDKKRQCDNVQDQMDGNACQRAVLVKDSCESYSECYSSKVESYNTARKVCQREERDRKGEWRALKRMSCLISAFNDGKVENSEVDACKKKTYNTNHLILKYPSEPGRDRCTVPDLYPSTPGYKQKEFVPLPALAKGHVASECIGVMEISTKPNKGSPKSCKCDRVTLNGPYSPGPMVKCTKCNDIRRTQDKSSCPDGTKVFSPRSREDWKTFIASASPLRNPHWIIDVTRPQNGCGGCTAHAMNMKVKKQKSWKTTDGSAWWLRSTRYSEPNGDYHANCFLDLWHAPKNENSVTFNDGSCAYHSKSYYCQPVILSTTPKKGSPTSCKCVKVGITGAYSPGALLRCTQCLDVRRSKEKNSCPKGTKIFSPRTRQDWGVVLESAKPLRSPHWIIDITRPRGGCGGCTRHAMHSRVASQATWKTSDGSAWWLRSTKYSEPNGDYTANCFLDLWRTPPNPDSVTFNDGRCNYHSNSYYCQPIMRRR